MITSAEYINIITKRSDFKFDFSLTEKTIINDLIKNNDDITEIKLKNLLKHYGKNEIIAPLVVRNKKLKMNTIALTHKGKNLSNSNKKLNKSITFCNKNSKS